MPFVLGDPTQTAPEIHVGDIGTLFISTIYNQNSEIVNLASATTITFRFISPNRTVLNKTGVLYTDGTDGKAYYTLADGDMNLSGVWKYQVVIAFVAGTWTTNIVDFIVYPNIPAS